MHQLSLKNKYNYLKERQKITSAVVITAKDEHSVNHQFI